MLKSKVEIKYRIESKILTPQEMAERRKEQNESVLRSHKLKRDVPSYKEPPESKGPAQEWKGPDETQMYEALKIVAKELRSHGWKTDPVDKGDEVLDVWGKKKSDGFIELTVGGEAFSKSSVSFVLMWTSGEDEQNYDVEMLVSLHEKKILEGLRELVGAIHSTFQEARDIG